ncbi:hypothetical protein DRW07_00630 [Alteromonas sediminis]|uniref:Uncharacterized protein n=1 Tax=Alteromonas sediminis TaxID=2259342 RepID=A0A3N5Y4B9_9ALTE|nr:hypothetical protein [Alteromonas sediminis]RPJ67953.1 hypothetical protein DRW07_00630 [Alteromonas sediminis]
MDAQKSDTESPHSQVYLFEELYRFMRESTGLAITAAYLILILSSMHYVYVFYGSFDIDIVKYVTFEDILATPIKNPDIILIFTFIIALLFAVDKSNAWRARLLSHNNDEPIPLFKKFLRAFFWSPQNRQANITLTILIVIGSLAVYTFTFAFKEAELIQEGEREHEQIELTVADGQVLKNVNLLGSTLNYVFIYDVKTQKSLIYYVESIIAITPAAKPAKTEQAPAPMPIKKEQPAQSDN